MVLYWNHLRFCLCVNWVTDVLYLKALSCLMSEGQGYYHVFCPGQLQNHRCNLQKKEHVLNRSTSKVPNHIAFNNNTIPLLAEYWGSMSTRIPGELWYGLQTPPQIWTNERCALTFILSLVGPPMKWKCCVVLLDTTCPIQRSTTAWSKSWRSEHYNTFQMCKF
jgi:hypothetical protein